MRRRLETVEAEGGGGVHGNANVLMMHQILAAMNQPTFLHQEVVPESYLDMMHHILDEEGPYNEDDHYDDWNEARDQTFQMAKLQLP